MRRILQKTPTPIAGLMLGLAGVGNLISTYGSQYRYLLGGLAAIIGLLISGRLINDWSGVRQELQQPIPASVAPAFAMAVMILATYLLPWSKQVAVSLWYVGIILHGLAIIFFTKRFLFNFKIRNVFPSYFIVYVGIVVASVTAPAMNKLQLGQWIFWFGFSSYMLVLPVVSYRVLKVGKIKEPALPTLTIFTAPAGLCLTGYLSSFPEPNLIMVGWLLLLTLSMVLPIIGYLPRMLNNGFYPSWSAFTFPLVITAAGLKLAHKFLATNLNTNLLLYPAQAITFLAVTLVLIVTVSYSNFLLEALVPQRQKSPSHNK
ncbi:MAG: TDT family transporter [Bacillota bacterium]